MELFPRRAGRLLPDKASSYSTCCTLGCALDPTVFFPFLRSPESRATFLLRATTHKVAHPEADHCPRPPGHSSILSPPPCLGATGSLRRVHRARSSSTRVSMAARPVSLGRRRWAMSWPVCFLPEFSPSPVQQAPFPRLAFVPYFFFRTGVRNPPPTCQLQPQLPSSPAILPSST